jgi:hypothetical protein
MNTLLPRSRTSRSVPGLRFFGRFNIYHLLHATAVVASALVLFNTAHGGLIPEPEQVMRETISHAVEFDALIISTDISDCATQEVTGDFSYNMATGDYTYSFPLQNVNGIPVSWSTSGSGNPATGQYSSTTNMHIGEEEILGTTTFTDYYGDPTRNFDINYVATVKVDDKTKNYWWVSGTGSITINADGTDTSTEHLNIYLWIESQQRWRYERTNDYTDTSTYDKDTKRATVNNSKGDGVIVKNNITVTFPEPASFVYIASGGFLLAFSLRRRLRLRA